MSLPGTATVATSASLLKTKYTQPKVFWEAYQNNPALATIRKDETFDGNNKQIAIQTETPQGGGTSIAICQTNLAASVYQNFLLTRISDFAIARVSGEALKAAEKSTGALLSLWQREMDGCIHTNMRSAAIALFRKGTGLRGQISSGSNVATATITLALTSDITNFAVGMTVQAANGDGGTLRSSGATAVLTGMNRVTGTLTISGNWNASIAAVAAGDVLLRNGDNNGMIAGIRGWVPDTDPGTADSLSYTPPTTYYGATRSTDITRMSGIRLSGTQVPFAEILVEAQAMAEVEGADVDTVWCHPRDKANLLKELSANISYTKVEASVKGSTATMSFHAAELETDTGGTIRIMGDLNCPRGTCIVTEWDTWTFESLGPAPQILDFDSNEFLRVTNDDSYEVRTAYYGNASNIAPAYTVNITNFGQ
jgi:hypothetical protein